jgi:hypothetical protein
MKFKIKTKFYWHNFIIRLSKMHIENEYPNCPNICLPGNLSIKFSPKRPLLYGKKAQNASSGHGTTLPQRVLKRSL